MNLEDQVANFELSKRLKELGVKQHSEFYHVEAKSISDYILENPLPFIAHISQYSGIGESFISAFTVAEFGDMLPYEIHGRFLVIEKCFSNLWQLKYTDEDYLRESIIFETKDHNEANARAKMLIRLLENGLMKND